MKIYIPSISIYKLSLVCLLLLGNAIAQNEIDSSGGGGFQALVPNGNIDPETGWPQGTLYDGSSSNESIWESATNYITQGGSGYLDVTQNADTDIYIDKTITFDNNNTHLINVAAASSRIRIFAQPGTQVDNNGQASALNITANRLEIYDGTYESEELNNNVANEQAVHIQNTSYAYFKNTTINGPALIANWIDNASGGIGLKLTSVGTAVIDFEADKSVNSINGGAGEIGETSFGATSPSGGTALNISGTSTLYATNLYAEGGVAGDFSGSIDRSSGAIFGGTADGGNGIVSSASGINLHQAEIEGTDGGSMQITAVSDSPDFNITFGADGGNGFNGSIGNGTINHATMMGGNAGTFNVDATTTGAHALTLNAGGAFNGSMNGGSILNSTFTGGNGVEYLTFTAGNATITMNGGDAMGASGSGTIDNGIFTAGDAGTAYIITTGSGNNTITGNGGNAYVGSGTIENSFFQGGEGGIFSMVGTNQTDVTLNGGVGAQTTGNTTLTSGQFHGGNGGRASVLAGEVDANGGDALLHTSGEINIYGGTFKGGSGGLANAQDGTARARAGLGAHVTGGNANFYDGTFTSGQDGVHGNMAQRLYSPFAAWFQGADNVLIASNATFNGDLLVNDTTSLAIEGGDIRGDIRFEDGTTGFSLSSDTAIQGMLIQEAGDVTANISTAANGAYYKNLLIQSGSFTFANQPLITAPNASFLLSSTNSQLTLQQGGTLSSGTSVGVQYGQMSSGNDLIVGTDSSIQLHFNGTTNGTLEVTGNLDLSAGGNARVSGAATQPSGVLYFGRATSITSPENIQTDIGWLTQSAFSLDGNQLRIDYSYRSLTNSASSFAALNEAHLLNIDSALTNSQHFAPINALGENDGSALILYDETQAPDVADAALDNQNYVHRQINARTMEIRARGGFANNTRRSHLPKPTGVAGPEHTKESNTRGWVRGYGAFGSRDESDTFDAYETTHYGTVIGIDRQFGSLLLGVAGGYSSINLDAGSTYNSDATGYNGSLYASWGSRESFLDLSIASAQHDVTTKNLLTTDTFDAESTSFHIGVGREWNLTDRLTCTPILAYQRTEYEQDGYLRDGITLKQMENYETSSDLLSLGATFSTARQYEWFNRHLAMIPEFRFRWLHELNPDLDALAFNYVEGGGSGSIRLRAREENLIELGLGIDFWSWHLYAAKFEFDYDYLLGEEYTEHTFSGKITFQF